MSTRSRIGYFENDENVITSIYCHFDGYPSNNGKILFESYKDLASLQKLISGGNLSSLNNLEYYTARGESFHQNKPIQSDLKGLFNSWEEYAYIFNPRDLKWYYCTSNLRLKELTQKAIENG